MIFQTWYHNKHQTIFFTDHKPIIFLLTQQCNPNHRVYRFQLTLRIRLNSHIVWTAGKTLSFSDSLRRNTPPERLTRKQQLKHNKVYKKFLTEDETSSRLESNHAKKIWTDKKQMSN